MSDESNFDPRKFGREWGKKFRDDLHDQIHRTVHENVDWRDARRRRPMVIGVDIRGRGRGGIVTGAILTIIGLVFLLDHLGYISINYLWRFWPMLIVLAGVGNLASRQRRAWGVFLIFGGTILQLNQLGITHFGWSQLWPMVLIALGLSVMWGSFGWSNKLTGSSTPATEADDPRTSLSEAVVFGGLERRMTSQDFQGGEITAIFGGVELDLTEANMQATETTLAVTAIFGGVEIRIPPNWQIAFRGAPIFGGIEDKTRTARADDSANVKTLVITGAVIFGGLEIKN